MSSSGETKQTAARRSLAAVFHSAGEPLELREFVLPALQAGEALVRVTCCTICGSDLHTIRGDRPVADPTVLGHEMIGRIVELPKEGPAICDVVGTPLAINDRVTWAVAASCGTCFFCEHDVPQKCQTLFKYGHETTERHALSGGLAEYCHLTRGTAIVRVPDSLSDHVACPANCATATVAAAIRTAGGCGGKSVVIHGAGMLGLTTAAMAASQGAASIMVTDVSEQRLARAKEFGATRSINVASGVTPLHEILTVETKGRGADIIFEMSGSPTVIEQSIDQLRIGGQLILVGSVFPTRAAELLPEQIVRKLLRIDGVHNYMPIDLRTAVDFLDQRAGIYPFHSLVEDECRLSDINELVQHALASQPVRVGVQMADKSV